MRRSPLPLTSEQAAGRDSGPSAQPDGFSQAKDVCLRLLTTRPRTRAELEKALQGKGFDEETAEYVLGRLDKAGLVDDASFAETWVRSRHVHQGLGRRAIAAELRRKGVDESVTAQAVAEVDPESEAERARELVRKKLRGMTSATAGLDETTKMRRLVGMLARKGYAEGLAFSIVREELGAADTEPQDP
ncbi:regulatory protein [Tamaricihabitans halophyticus]|uniref:Regulatory protein RecX n=1 Tax=Tamaricihabitans halophyticus TaxID=1262583 RepID=A0A4R2R0R2_9PSEU|nr:regulatory protein RecX [Tamaricihabitans halophyticus]TCP55159.1 regulatory protein [Tamaricihabitans halophyticus]